MTEWNEAKRWHNRHENPLFITEIVCHCFRENVGPYDQPCIWNTYIKLSDTISFSKTDESGKLVLCDKYRIASPTVDLFWDNMEPLHGLDWNGGITLEEKTTSDLGLRQIKVGDDYAHLWDLSRFELYTLEYMQRQCEKLSRDFRELCARLTTD